MRKIIECKSCGNSPRVHKGRGLCTTCYDREYNHGTLDNWPLQGRRQADVVEDVTHLASNLVPAIEWGARMGMTEAALERSLYRAGQFELARQMARIRWPRRKELV